MAFQKIHSSLRDFHPVQAAPGLLASTYSGSGVIRHSAVLCVICAAKLKSFRGGDKEKSLRSNFQFDSKFRGTEYAVPHHGCGVYLALAVKAEGAMTWVGFRTAKTTLSAFKSI